MMNKNGVIGVGVLLVLLILIIGTFIKVLLLGRSNSIDNTRRDTNLILTDEKNGFTFHAEYKGENVWEYKINGEVPSPCHNYKIDALVLESYPEQVSLVIAITKPSEEDICVQVIKKIEETGTFSAGENAKISFLVTNI